MANHSLEHSAATLKPTPYDLLVTSLEKAKALIEVATFEPFASCHQSTIHNYMCALGEIVDDAMMASEDLEQKRGEEGKGSLRKAD